MATGLGLGAGIGASVWIRSIAEVTLVWVLFADASRVSPAELRGNLGLEVRLLFLGLPLTTIVGAVVAVGVLGVSPWFALLIGAALAPTDAALGSAVMSDRRVDHRVRQTLNVESGLNDGIATPIVTLALASIVAQAGGSPSDHAAGPVIGLAIGAGTGLLLGASGGAVVRFTRRRGWSSDEAVGPGLLALALLAYIGALLLGGNGFVAAFLAGSAFGAVGRRGGEAEVYYVEQTCGLASIVSWLLFGAVAVPVIIAHVDWRVALYALLSLTFIRMAPVALALVGTTVDRSTVFFIGWFGPRGLASIVFALIAAEELHGLPGPVDVAVTTIGLTVLLSVVAHGLTARPLGGVGTRPATRAPRTPTGSASRSCGNCPRHCDAGSPSLGCGRTLREGWSLVRRRRVVRRLPRRPIDALDILEPRFDHELREPGVPCMSTARFRRFLEGGSAVEEAELDLFVATYDDPATAQQDWHGMKELVGEGAVAAEAMVLVRRTEDGKFHIKDNAKSVAAGAGIGAVGGALLGVLFPPSLLASALVGAGIGSASGAVVRQLEKHQVVADMEQIILPGSSGIVVLVDERASALLLEKLPNAKKVEQRHAH